MKEIPGKKEILFGAFSEKLTKEDEANESTEIHVKT